MPVRVHRLRRHPPLTRRRLWWMGRWRPRVRPLAWASVRLLSAPWLLA